MNDSLFPEEEAAAAERKMPSSLFSWAALAANVSSSSISSVVAPSRHSWVADEKALKDEGTLGVAETKGVADRSTLMPSMLVVSDKMSAASRLQR